MTKRAEHPAAHKVETLESVVIRFAGDSGDGMQLTGDRFTTESAPLFGNDLATFPDFPAEIRAPAGHPAPASRPSRSTSRTTTSSRPGDAPNVLVAMNPAALKANLADLAKGATLIVNSDAFDERNLAKAGYETEPARPTARSAAYTRLRGAHDLASPRRSARRPGSSPATPSAPRTSSPSASSAGCTPGPIEPTLEWIAERFADKPLVAEANIRAFRAGYDFGETAELFESQLRGPAGHRSSRASTPTSPATPRWPGASSPPSQQAGLPAVPRQLPDHPGLGHPPRALQAARSSACAPSRPRTRSPASAPRSAPPSAAPSASPPPAARASTSSPRRSAWPSASSCRSSSSTSSAAAPRPGCRPRPSRPTCCTPCTAATARRRCPSWPPRPPSHCFDAAIEAVRMAVKYRTPVILLSDGYLANGSEPWRLPDLDALPAIDPGFATAPNHVDDDGTEAFWPYLRDPETLARPWAPPGTAGARAPHRRPREGRRHRATSPTTGPTTSAWSHLRAAKIAGIAADIPPRRGRRRDRRRRAAGDRLGLHLRRRSPPASQRVRARGHRRSAQAHLRPPQPVPGRTWATCWAATTRCWCPRSTWASSAGCCGPSTWSTPRP